MDWVTSDYKYYQVKGKVLLAVLCIGLAATFVGGMYNQIYGYHGLPVLVHVIGFALLAVLLVVFICKKLRHSTIACIALAYFCFFYTPFAWLTLGGLYSSMSYVVYIFSLLAFILLEGRVSTAFAVAYLVEVFVLALYDVLYIPLSMQYVPVVPLAFSCLVMLFVLDFVMCIYKRQFTAFLNQNRRDSITDVLTGLHNHRYLTDLLASTARWQQQSPTRDYTIAVIDLDDFKQINDTYGHSVGDDVLHELGSVLGHAFCGHEVGRYGGDEFVAVLRNMPFESCVQICEKLRLQVERRAFTPQHIRVSVSIGVCSRSQIEGRDVFVEADMLLYRAKEQSKNKVMYYE